jgi:integrase
LALSILELIRPVDPASTDRVFLGRTGKPIKSIRTSFDNAVATVWKPARLDEQKPRFHDLRKTGATRVEAVSSHAVARAFLGHSDRDVTDTYLVATLDAVNRAARSIDGEKPPGVIEFPTGTAHQTAQQSSVAIS